MKWAIEKEEQEGYRLDNGRGSCMVPPDGSLGFDRPRTAAPIPRLPSSSF